MVSMQAALTNSGLFSEVELGLTEDPDRMVIGVCRCAQDVLPWEAGLGFERAWATTVMDLPWQRHAVGCTETLAEFEGAATVDASGHYITVTVVAEPPQGIAAPRPDEPRTQEKEPTIA
jgi:hypothetical protein